MTSYSSGALRDLRETIIDNVIRRYLSEFGWYRSRDGGFQAGGWDGMLPGRSGAGGPVLLRLNPMASTYKADPPPGAAYLGDEQQGMLHLQRWEVDPDAVYQPWIERVNDAFDGWLRLPRPTDFDVPIAHLAQAVDELTPEAQNDGSYTFVDVEVSNAIGLMHTWISPQGDSSSDLLYAFDAAYGVGRIAGVMTNQAQVAAGLGFTVAGERQLWSKARADIMQIATEAAAALDLGGGGGGSIDLGVVKAFVDLVGVFVPQQYKILTGALSAGVGFLDKVIPEQTTEAKRVTIDGFSAEEMLASIESAIRDLESAIYHEELELVRRLRELRDLLGSRSASDFHLHPDAGIDQELTDAAQIRFDSAAVRRVGTQNVPTVAAAFLRAAEQASAQTGDGIWTRENLIGLGHAGPHYQWRQVIEEFDAITTGSARELVEAGKTLAIAAGWIENADIEAEFSGQRLADELSRGQTSWTYSYP